MSLIGILPDGNLILFHKYLINGVILDYLSLFILLLVPASIFIFVVCQVVGNPFQPVMIFFLNKMGLSRDTSGSRSFQIKMVADGNKGKMGGNVTFHNDSDDNMDENDDSLISSALIEGMEKKKKSSTENAFDEQDYFQGDNTINRNSMVKLCLLKENNEPSIYYKGALVLYLKESEEILIYGENDSEGEFPFCVYDSQRKCWLDTNIPQAIYNKDENENENGFNNNDKVGVDINLDLKQQKQRHLKKNKSKSIKAGKASKMFIGQSLKRFFLGERLTKKGEKKMTISMTKAKVMTADGHADTGRDRDNASLCKVNANANFPSFSYGNIFHWENYIIIVNGISILESTKAMTTVRDNAAAASAATSEKVASLSPLNSFIFIIDTDTFAWTSIKIPEKFYKYRYAAAATIIDDKSVDAIKKNNSNNFKWPVTANEDENSNGIKNKNEKRKNSANKEKGFFRRRSSTFTFVPGEKNPDANANPTRADQENAKQKQIRKREEKEGYTSIASKKDKEEKEERERADRNNSMGEENDSGEKRKQAILSIFVHGGVSSSCQVLNDSFCLQFKKSKLDKAMKRKIQKYEVSKLKKKKEKMAEFINNTVFLHDNIFDVSIEMVRINTFSSSSSSSPSLFDNEGEDEKMGYTRRERSSLAPALSHHFCSFFHNRYIVLFAGRNQYIPLEEESIRCNSVSYDSDFANISVVQLLDLHQTLKNNDDALLSSSSSSSKHLWNQNINLLNKLNKNGIGIAPYGKFMNNSIQIDPSTSLIFTEFPSQHGIFNTLYSLTCNTCNNNNNNNNNINLTFQLQKRNTKWEGDMCMIPPPRRNYFVAAASSASSTPSLASVKNTTKWGKETKEKEKEIDVLEAADKMEIEREEQQQKQSKRLFIIGGDIVSSGGLVYETPSLVIDAN